MAIGVQGTVAVEMIGSEIGDDGDIGRRVLSVEVFELEAAEFEHDPVVRTDRVESRQQAAANVAAQPGRLTRRFEDRMDHRRRGRLAIASGYGNRPGRTQFPEQADLGRQPRSAAGGQFQPRTVDWHGRIDHHQLGLHKILTPMLTQSPGDPMAWQFVEPIDLVSQFAGVS